MTVPAGFAPAASGHAHDVVTVGFHASHEQLPPSALLAAVRRAEAAGFAAAMCSEHLAPWSERQGHSGFAWSWLGAALEATSLPFGVVTAPGQRQHPVRVAHAIATLAEMFPAASGPRSARARPSTSTSPATGGPTSRRVTPACSSAST